MSPGHAAALSAAGLAHAAGVKQEPGLSAAMGLLVDHNHHNHRYNWPYVFIFYSYDFFQFNFIIFVYLLYLLYYYYCAIRPSLVLLLSNSNLFYEITRILAARAIYRQKYTLSNTTFLLLYRFR